MARSLVFKNGWWKNIPASIDQIDVAYQKKIEALFDQWPVFEKNIEWITEKNAGIALTFIVMGTVFYFVFSKQLNKRSWLLLPWVGICLGLSDLSSTLLKKFFGRLKPFVDHIGTGDVHHPPFSFPSNHSFNSFTLAFLLYLLIRWTPLKKAPHAQSFSLSMIGWACFIGFSRLFLGEHYPLDVLFGAIFAGSFSLLYYFSSRSVLRKFSISEG